MNDEVFVLGRELLNARYGATGMSIHEGDHLFDGILAKITVLVQQHCVIVAPVIQAKQGFQASVAGFCKAVAGF
jgi:hypothetical protein